MPLCPSDQSDAAPKKKSALFVLLVCSVCATNVHADWPHVRGPAYDGVSRETSLADAWPADGPRQLWSKQLGQGYSGVVIAGNRVFMQYQTAAGQFLICLDAETGATLWETRYDWAWQPGGAYPGPYASPTWHDGKVYYTSPAGIVGCMDATSGASLWSFDVVSKFEGKGCDFGYAATPLVEDGRVVLPVGGARPR
jgi:outer membrane protein assembly factor BamB